MINQDGPLLQVLTTKSQADKAIHSLKGILLGINLDGEVNEKEVAELQHWAASHRGQINRNPFNEFITCIETAASEGTLTTETVEDLYWLTQKYETDSYYYKTVTTDLHILQGLCHGILADGTIKEKEVIALQKWLEANEHLNTYYPYDEIRSLLISVLADKKVDEDEKRILKAHFSQFIKLSNPETALQLKSEIEHLNVTSFCTSDPEITFTKKTFCVTGVLKRSTRQELHNKIIALGGIPTESITRKTNYLIVGDNGNPAWAFACYGRKVEKAVNLRKEGHTITLIHEFDFADIVDDLISDL